MSNFKTLRSSDQGHLFANSKIAAKNAMEVMGYVVTVKDGWIVRAHSDGRVEQIEELQTA